jgi:phage terminase small subunit
MEGEFVYYSPQLDEFSILDNYDHARMQNYFTNYELYVAKWQPLGLIYWEYVGVL